MTDDEPWDGLMSLPKNFEQEQIFRSKGGIPLYVEIPTAAEKRDRECSGMPHYDSGSGGGEPGGVILSNGMGGDDFENYCVRSLPTGSSDGSHESPRKRFKGPIDQPDFPHLQDKLTWMQSYENLVAYKAYYGDCHVPQKFKFNPKLGRWVNKQRKRIKNPEKYGKVTPEQFKMLSDLGFKW